MKLRNKKTGQEGNFIINKDHFKCVDLDYVPEYRNLAELNEEWEDCGEPDEIWYIDWVGEIRSANINNEWDGEKQIGNYFETEEEAELAVEKLKALKRLKDKGFRFDGWEENHHNLGIIEFSFDKVDNNVWDFKEDLDLLFGGKE